MMIVRSEPYKGSVVDVVDMGGGPRRFRVRVNGEEQYGHGRLVHRALGYSTAEAAAAAGRRRVREKGVL